MGLLDNLKIVKAWAEEAYASQPKFARITTGYIILWDEPPQYGRSQA